MTVTVLPLPMSRVLVLELVPSSYLALKEILEAKVLIFKGKIPLLFDLD